MSDSSRPNLLILFPDQWRWDWLGCEIPALGKVPVLTPNIDALARRGVRFTQCRTNSPLCSPARACLSLGVRYERCGVAGNQQITPTDRPTFFRQLRDAGYHTATCGKSDLFKPDKTDNPGGYLPIMSEYGFSDGIDHRGKGDAVYWGRAGIAEPYTIMLRERGLLDMHLHDHPANPLDRAAYPTPLPKDAYTDDFCRDNALRLLARAPADKPWCLWVNFPGPHDPFDPPRSVLDRYRGTSFPPPVAPGDTWPAHRDPSSDRLHYAGACSNIDDAIGRILAELECRGELDRTIVIFTSDHGEMLGDHGRWAKSVWYEPSIHVPLIIAGPGVHRGEVDPSLVELIDVAATATELGGAKPVAGWDSRSLAARLGTTLPHAPHRTATVSALGSWRCVTDGRWKLVTETAHPPRLFDLHADPAEVNDLAGSQPEQADGRFVQIMERLNTSV